MQVMAAPFAALGVNVRPSGRKYPLPRPLAGCVWILHPQPLRQGYIAGAGSQVRLVLLSNRVEVRSQRSDQRLRQRRCAIAHALGSPHDDLTRLEIDVLDAKLGALL
jgi:hypothetical protein